MNKPVSELIADFDLALTSLSNKAHEMSDRLKHMSEVEAERDLLIGVIEERTVRIAVLLDEL